MVTREHQSRSLHNHNDTDKTDRDTNAFNSTCNTDSLYNYIVTMFDCFVIASLCIIDSDIFHSTFNSTFVNSSKENKLTYE